MTRYVLRRVAGSIPILLGVTVITFTLVHLASGNAIPGVSPFDPRITAADMARLRHNLGLDAPLYVQYLRWLGGALHGDLGRSLLDGSPVSTLIAQRLPNTLLLTLSATAMATVVAIPLGVLSALHRGRGLDHVLTAFSVTGASMPGFWLGLVMILFFSVLLHRWNLPALPSAGALDPISGGDPLDRLAHLAMPATVLAVGLVAEWARYIRFSLLEVLDQDYIRTARAKGMGERRVIYLHGLRNALIPFITLAGLQIPSLVGGAAIVEVVFSWPGMGRLALERALALDYNVVFALTTLGAVLVVGGNLLADLLYALLDPRIDLR